MNAVAAAPVAWALIAINVAVGLFTLQGGRAHWVAAGVLRPAWIVRQRAWWTLVTCGFLHGDLAHLAFNMISLWAFGPSLERQIGSAGFALLYALGLVASSIGSWWAHRDDPGYATLGASGAVLAVLFAFIVYQPGARMFVFPLPLPVPAPLFALGYLVYSIVSARRDAALRGAGHAGGSGINHGAHLVGAAVGVLYVAWTDPDALARAAGWVVGLLG